MIEFFAHAAANLQTGSSSKLVELLGSYRQQHFSGQLSADFEQRGWLSILLLDGTVVGAYYLTGSTSTPFPPTDIDRWWSGEVASIRSLALPGGAVRLLGMACEWHPPAQSLLVQSSSMQNVLQVFLVNKTSGLLYVSDNTGELAVPIIDGYSIASEAIFSTAQVEIGSSALQAGMQSTSRDRKIVLFEARVGSPSFKQLVLRQVVTELAANLLARYNQIVGKSMIGAMGNELNQVLKINNLQMKLIGDHLDDSHVFPTAEDASRSYSVLFKAIDAHMTHVIGGNLASSLQKEAYRSLDPRSQAAIAEQPTLKAIQR
jgi:hypothetical protein